MDTEKRYYVYVWFKPDDTPFYVGKGSGDRWKRHGVHHRNEYFLRVYKKYPGCYSKIVTELLDEETAFEKEKELIAEYRSKGYALTNFTNGGEGIGKKVTPTEDFREKMRQLVSGEKNPNYQNYWSDEQKQHLSKVRKESGMSKGANNPRAKRVMCVETGKIYEYQQQASDELGLCSMASIYHALKKPNYVAGGFHFVQGEDIDRLNTEEKRQEYLLSLAS